jgi:hypothetical protein
VESNWSSLVSRPTGLRTVSGFWLNSQNQLVWFLSEQRFEKRACRGECRRYLHLLCHRCLPFSPSMSIFRRCWRSRPLTASGRCVSRKRLHLPWCYVHTLINEKNAAKRGLVYPKLAQSKGSGDRMHSTDLFWGSRKVSAAGISEPEPKGVVVPRAAIDLANVSYPVHMTR